MNDLINLLVNPIWDGGVFNTDISQICTFLCQFCTFFSNWKCVKSAPFCVNSAPFCVKSAPFFFQKILEKSDVKHPYVGLG